MSRVTCPECGHEFMPRPRGKWFKVLSTLHNHRIWEGDAPPKVQGVIAKTVAEWMPNYDGGWRNVFHILQREEVYDKVRSEKAGGNRYWWLTGGGREKVEYMCERMKE